MQIITGTIDRIEEKQLVITTGTGKQIIVPKESDEFQEGDAIKIICFKNNKSTEQYQNLAKDILNKILKNTE